VAQRLGAGRQAQAVNDVKCANCQEEIRPVERGDGIADEDRELYPWVNDLGNPICDITLTHEPPLTDVPGALRDATDKAMYDPRTDTVQMTVWPQELAEVDVIAARNGATRHDILRLFLKDGLEANQ
jgi:hypothetical protein